MTNQSRKIVGLSNVVQLSLQIIYVNDVRNAVVLSMKILTRLPFRGFDDKGLKGGTIKP